MSVPIGYQLHITSWENDADNYKTEIISGLTKDQAQYLIDISGLLDCMSYGGNFLNADQINELYDKFLNIQEQYTDKFDEHFRSRWFLESAVEDEDKYGYLSDVFTSLVSNSGEEYWGDVYFRVCDSVEVFYVHAPIENVTKEFKV